MPTVCDIVKCLDRLDNTALFLCNNLCYYRVARFPKPAIEFIMCLFLLKLPGTDRPEEKSVKVVSADGSGYYIVIRALWNRLVPYLALVL